MAGLGEGQQGPEGEESKEVWQPTLRLDCHFEGGSGDVNALLGVGGREARQGEVAEVLSRTPGEWHVTIAPNGGPGHIQARATIRPKLRGSDESAERVVSNWPRFTFTHYRSSGSCLILRINSAASFPQTVGLAVKQRDPSDQPRRSQTPCQIKGSTLDVESSWKRHKKRTKNGAFDPQKEYPGALKILSSKPWVC